MTLTCLLPNWVENWLTWLQLCSSQRRQENTLVKILMNTEITLESLDPHGLSPLERAGGGGEGGWDCFVDMCQCCLLSRFFPQSPPTPSPSHCTPSTSSNSALPPPHHNKWSNLGTEFLMYSVLSTYHISFIHASVDELWIGSTFWLLWIMLLWTGVYK